MTELGKVNASNDEKRTNPLRLHCKLEAQFQQMAFLPASYNHTLICSLHHLSE